MQKEKPKIIILEFIQGTTKARVLGRSGNEYVTDYGLGTCECEFKQKWSKGKPCAHLNHIMAVIGGPDWEMPVPQ
ncbi:MAG: hypothetical protein WCS94_25530 [Verrucomicrobiota bacterium]